MLKPDTMEELKRFERGGRKREEVWKRQIKLAKGE
jgi:hypothetical protein